MSAYLHIQTKLEVGKKYRIRNFAARPGHWNSSGEMDKWLNRVVTIKRQTSDGRYRIFEDECWCWQEGDFEEVKEAEWDT
jgi:hypothetical protein